MSMRIETLPWSPSPSRRDGTRQHLSNSRLRRPSRHNCYITYLIQWWGKCASWLLRKRKHAHVIRCYSFCFRQLLHPQSKGPKVPKIGYSWYTSNTSKASVQNVSKNLLEGYKKVNLVGELERATDWRRNSFQMLHSKRRFSHSERLL